MAKILLVLSLLISAGTCFLTLQTKPKVIALQEDLSTTKGTLSTTKDTLVKTEGELKTTAENLTAAKATIDERDKDLVAQKAEKEKVDKELAEAAKNLEQKTMDLAKVNTDLMASMAKTQEVMTNNEALSADLMEVKSMNVALIQENVILKEKIANLSKPGPAGPVQDGPKVVTDGKVISYDNDWRFVTVDLGDKKGMKANTLLLIMRSGQVIARARVTKVEPATSVADILSGPCGPRCMPSRGLVVGGDKVVVAGDGVAGDLKL